MTQQENPFPQFLDEYGPCPPEQNCGYAGCAACGERVVRFFREVLAIEPDAWQLDFIRAYGRGERKISVRACHGPGKTLVAAGCAWHQLICRFPHHSVVTAPTKSQLFGAFMKEMRTIHSKLPLAFRDAYEVTTDKIVKKDAPAECLFEARTAREEKPEALQGVHCEAGWVLMIVDEASGVHEKIFESGQGSMSGYRVTTILLSNPTRSSGFFHDTHMKPGMREGWYKIHVSADDSPRVSEEFKNEVALAYGIDSNAYRVRVLGEFPKADSDTVIGFELVESARGRDVVMTKDMVENWGVDVGRFGDDASAMVRRNRLGVTQIDVWKGLDLMSLTGKIKKAYDEVILKPEEILVDEIGMGGGVLDRLREMGLPARGINVSESASADDKYKGLRSELWFLGREWLEGKNRSLPQCPGGCARECPHEQLASELVVPRYKVMSDGRLFVEPKDVMKKRGHKSPNVADAFLMTFASEPSTLLHGSEGKGGWGRMPWSQPIERNTGGTLI